MLKDTLITQDLEFPNNSIITFNIESIVTDRGKSHYSADEKENSKFSVSLLHDSLDKNKLFINFPIDSLPDSNFVVLKPSISSNFSIKYNNSTNYKFEFSTPNIKVFTSFNNKDEAYSSTIGKMLSYPRSYASDFGALISMVTYE